MQTQDDRPTLSELRQQEAEEEAWDRYRRESDRREEEYRLWCALVSGLDPESGATARAYEDWWVEHCTTSEDSYYWWVEEGYGHP